MKKNPEKQLVIVTNVSIDIENEVGLEPNLLNLKETAAIQRFWFENQKWIDIWTGIRWLVFIAVMLLLSKFYFSAASFWLGLVVFVVCLVAMVFSEIRLIRKHIEDYPEKLSPVLEIYRQTVLSAFLALRMEKYEDLLMQIFPNTDVDDIDRYLDKAYDAHEVIHITKCTLYKFNYLVIEEQLGNAYPLFDYDWDVEGNMFLQKNMYLKEVYLDENRNIVLVIKGDGLQNLILKQEHLIKSQSYSEVW